MLRVGIVGGGINSAVGRAHLSALNLDGGWQIVSGLFSRNNQTNEASGKMWRCPQVYNSLDSFVKEQLNLIDAVLVLTPTPSHFEIIRQLLENGFNVISEKSLCTTPEEALTLEKIADKNHRKLHVTFNYTGYPMVREISKRIHDGRYGLVHSIQIEMPQEGFTVLDQEGRTKKIQEWRQLDYQIPTVSLDLGVHVNNLAHFLLGNYQHSVIGSENHFGKVAETIDSVNYLARYQGGTEGNFWFGKSFLGNRNGLKIRLFGIEGAVEWVQMNPDSFWEWNQKGQKKQVDLADLELVVANHDRYMRFKAGHPTGFIEAFANSYQDIRASLQGDSLSTSSCYTFGAREAFYGLQELRSVHLSSLNGSWQETGISDEFRIRC